jgi:2'-5' RNA ligase
MTVAALAFNITAFFGCATANAAPPDAVTAIDILLEPDAKLSKLAVAANERLRKSYPKGFALDETHRPHITILQRYVKTVELDKAFDAVGKALADEKPTELKLKASKYYLMPANDLALGGIMIEPTDDLTKLQLKMTDAVAPFAVKSGTAAAFFTTKEDPDINQSTIDFVADFVPIASGKKFNPHVTIGLATQDSLKTLIDEPFEPFTLSPAGVSVYKLGNFGTARKKLKGWVSSE